jgi:hypothetical protein
VPGIARSVTSATEFDAPVVERNRAADEHLINLRCRRLGVNGRRRNLLLFQAPQINRDVKLRSATFLRGITDGWCQSTGKACKTVEALIYSPHISPRSDKNQ